MDSGHFGDYVKMLRKEKNLTQSELSDELGMSVSSLCRIETGLKKPSYTEFRLLMQTLGEASDDFAIVHMTNSERDIFRAISRLSTAMRDGRLDKAAEVLDSIGDCDLEGENLQFVTYAKIALSANSDPRRSIAELADAVRLKRKGFDFERIAQYRLSYNEIVILGEIANLYCRLDDEQSAVNILLGVKESMDNFCLDEREKAKTYPAILYNLTTLLGKRGRYGEVLEMCDAAISMALEHNRLLILPYLIYNIASAKFYKGDVEGCREALSKAYKTSLAMRDFNFAATIKSDAENYLSIALD